MLENLGLSWGSHTHLFYRKRKKGSNRSFVVVFVFFFNWNHNHSAKTFQMRNVSKKIREQV